MPSPRKLSDQLCACGCGRRTPFAKKTDRRRAQRAGEPIRFIAGHNKGTGAGAGEICLTLDKPAQGEVTQSVLSTLRQEPDADVAKRLDSRIRELERQHRRSFVELGLICNEMADRSLWQELVNPETGNFFQSFGSWLMDAAQVAHSSAYKAMKVLKELSDVPVEDLQEMSRANVIIVSQLSTKVRRDPKVIAAAKTQTEAAFHQILETDYPEQHIESTARMDLKPTRSARKVIDEALRAAGLLYGVEGREAQLEAICSYFMDGDCEMEEYEGIKNRRAYEIASDHGLRLVTNAETHAHPVA